MFAPRRPQLVLASFLCILGSSRVGAAEPAGRTPALTAAAPAGATPPAAAPPSPPSGVGANDPFVRVDDPMLAPPAPPAHVIGSWRQALDLVRTRSVDLRTAHAQIETARGRARMTMAGAL
ncbi:MAG TPA: hypothetical protein VLC09_16965, partial [Polyangiaceae bacterium]|nr:hypothetical protein [Polyangiaceae bacterium]